MKLMRLMFGLVAALSVGGCFDVRSAKSPLLIDNFDDGDVFPTDQHFDQWRCGRYKPNKTEDCACGYDDSTYWSDPYSLYLAANVAEEGTDKSSGAHLYTQAVVPEDLSHRSAIVFSAMLEQGDYPSASRPILYVELHCSHARPTDDSNPSDLWAFTSVSYSSDWQQFTIGLSGSDFRVGYQDIEGGLVACLARIDSIHFSVNAQLDHGQTGSFILHVDDVYFQ
jgi:hypothetical protein